MDGANEGLATLSRSERTALRNLLIGTTAAAGGCVPSGGLGTLVEAAPVQLLPAAADLHRIAGTVLLGLVKLPGAPAAVCADLDSLRSDAAFNHLISIGALSQIAAEFDRANLTWVVMKGPVAAGLLYPGVGDRSYLDIDLLVQAADFARAVQILEDLGYRHSVHNWALAEEMLAGEIGLTSPHGSIDLHWHLHYGREDRRPFALSPEVMLERSRRVLVSSLDVPTFDSVDTLLTLAFHAARSDGHRLMWIKDIERSIMKEQPDFDELVRRSLLARCGPPVGLMLARARRLLRAPVPDDVIRALVPASLMWADQLMSAMVPPIQLHERSTATRTFTRSVRSSTFNTLGALPGRGVRFLERSLRPPAENETDDVHEKESYLRAVRAEARQDLTP